MYQWSTTPANNASAGSINWAEQQPASTVNDSARQMMADVATWYAGPEWLNYGVTPTYVSATVFTMAGNQGVIYPLGRRVRATVSAGTIYGTISASAFTSLTTVTVKWDSGALDSGLSEVDVGLLNPAFSSLPSFTNFSCASLTVTGGNGLTLSEIVSPFVAPIAFGDGSGWTLAYQTMLGATFATMTDQGNMTIAGTLTQHSDRRLKTDIRAIDNALKRLQKLNGITYRLKDGDVRQIGLIAQDVQRAAPEAVKEGPGGYLSVAYGNLVGLLVEAIKELSAEVDALKSK
jgi:hypothetical protein